MPNVLRPRQESPTPLMRLVLPFLVAAPVMIGELFAKHPPTLVLATLVACACLAPFMLLARRWWEVAVMACFVLFFLLVVAAIVASSGSSWELPG